MESNNQNSVLAPVRVMRRLSKEDQQVWFDEIKDDLEIMFGEHFRPRVSASVTLALIEDVSQQTRKHRIQKGITTGYLRRQLENNLPADSRKPLESRVMWTNVIHGRLRSHLTLALADEQLSQEIEYCKQTLQNLGYVSLRNPYIGPHLTLGSFSARKVPKEATEIINMRRPETARFEPVRILKRTA